VGRRAGLPLGVVPLECVASGRSGYQADRAKPPKQSCRADAEQGAARAIAAGVTRGALTGDSCDQFSKHLVSPLTGEAAGHRKVPRVPRASDLGAASRGIAATVRTISASGSGSAGDDGTWLTNSRLTV